MGPNNQLEFDCIRDIKRCHILNLFQLQWGCNITENSFKGSSLSQLRILNNPLRGIGRTRNMLLKVFCPYYIISSYKSFLVDLHFTLCSSLAMPYTCRGVCSFQWQFEVCIIKCHMWVSYALGMCTSAFKGGLRVCEMREYI